MEFKVVLEGIELDEEDARRLNHAIQTAALKALVRTKVSPEFTVRIPRKEWLGIWIGPLGPFEGVGRG